MSIAAPNFIDFQNKHTLDFLRKRHILNEDETVNDLYQRVIGALVEVERKFNSSESEIESLKVELLTACDSRIIALGAPVLLNAGKEDRSLSSCTIIPIDLKGDLESMKNSIFPYYQKDMGSGFNLNEVEDPIATLKSLNQILLDITPRVKRPPCGMAMLDIDHPRIEEFINFKRDVDFFKWRFNLSIGMTKDFMDAVKNKDFFTLRNGAEVDADELFTLATDAAYFCGEPGMVFLDGIDRDNPIPSYSCNTVVPCAEMALSEGEVCQFSYLNVSKMVKGVKAGKVFDFSILEKHAKLLTRMLDNAIEISIENAVGNSDVIEGKRRFAIGMCGVADLFLDLGMLYNSREAQELLSNIMATINVCSKEASVELSKKRNSFPFFNESRFSKEGFASRFKQHVSKIPKERWERLEQSILDNGIRNSGTTALPPTGISAMIVKASPSIEPRFSLLDNEGNIISSLYLALETYWNSIGLENEERKVILARIKETGSLPTGIEEKKISKEIQKLFLVAHQVDWKSQLEMVAAVQRFNDESVSKTVNCLKVTTSKEIKEIFQRAHDMGLKGITAFRDGCLEEREIPLN